MPRALNVLAANALPRGYRCNTLAAARKNPAATAVGSQAPVWS